MNLKKLFARPVTKRAIYKRLSQFIDDNYVAYSPEPVARAKPKVYTPTTKTKTQTSVPATKQAPQEPVPAVKPVPQVPCSPAEKQTTSSFYDGARFSAGRSTLESKTEPAGKDDSGSNVRFSLSADAEDSGIRFSLSTDDEDDGIKFSREPRYSIGSIDRFKELPKTPRFEQPPRDYHRSPLEKRDEPPKTKTEVIAQLVSSTERKEKFTACMLRFMSKKGLSDANVYNRVFMDRRLFNKIRNNPDYQPNKRTALLIALALKLTYKETQDLLETAGFTLSRSNKRDVIIEFYIREGNYDIFEINEMLEHFKQPLLMKCD